jgi:serine/threonine-protein phosphatase 2B catalytic subunit
VVQILSAVLNICSETELKNEEILLNEKNMDMIKSLDQAHKGIVSERDEQKEQEEQEEQITDAVPFRDSIQKKLAMVGRMSRILALMREERESIDELKSLNGGILPKQLLIDGREKLHHTLHGFQQARVVDMENEGLPPATPRHATGDDDTATDTDEAPEPDVDTPGADNTGHWDHFLFEWARRRKWGLGSGSADK